MLECDTNLVSSIFIKKHWILKNFPLPAFTEFTHFEISQVNLGYFSINVFLASLFLSRHCNSTINVDISMKRLIQFKFERTGVDSCLVYSEKHMVVL